MNRILGVPALLGILFLFALIASNGALSYYYLDRIAADARKASEGQPDGGWTDELNYSKRSAVIGVLNSTIGALLLLGAVYALVRRDMRTHLAAEALREAEQIRFRRLVEMDAIGVLFIEVDGRVTDASDKFLTMIGYPREDLLAGRINWRSLTPAEFDGADLAALDELDRRGLAKPYEKEFLRRDGTRVPVLFGSARLDTAPDKTHCICYAIDLSESRAAQATIRELNRELQDRVHELETLFELAPVGLGLSSDPACGHLAVNSLLADMFGVSPDGNASPVASIGHQPPSYRILRDGAQLEADAFPMRQVAATGQPLVNQELEIRRANGASIRVLSSVAPLFDDEHKCRGSVGAFMDITHLKEVEMELMQNNRAKDAMLTMLGHELRNPLAALAGAGELISTHPPQEPIYQQALAILRRQVQHLTRLVNEMLDLAKLTAGAAKLRLAPLDLTEPLKAAVQAARPLIESRQLELRVDLPRGVLEVEGDAARLEQVFAQLLSNAAKFTEPGGKIDLVARSEGAVARVRMRDTGIGLDSSRIPSMFDLFAQVRPDLDRSAAGLGVGLTLVRSAVKLHRGTVTVTSEGLGKGSEFVVELPLTANSAKPRPGNASSDEVTRGAGRRRSKCSSSRTSPISAALCRRFWPATDTTHTGPPRGPRGSSSPPKPSPTWPLSISGFRA